MDKKARPLTQRSCFFGCKGTKLKWEWRLFFWLFFAYLHFRVVYTKFVACILHRKPWIGLYRFPQSLFIKNMGGQIQQRLTLVKWLSFLRVCGIIAGNQFLFSLTHTIFFSPHFHSQMSGILTSDFVSLTQQRVFRSSINQCSVHLSICIPLLLQFVFHSYYNSYSAK